jgi:phage tail protein X
MLHIPLIRRGVPYRSLDAVCARHHATGEAFVEISHANPGLIRRDLLAQGSMRDALLAIPTARLIDMTRAAASIFANDTLPIGETTQSPDDYVHQVSATTGCPTRWSAATSRG